MKNERVQPHSVEAEQSLLGAILIDNVVWESACVNLEVDDFYHPAHRIIFGHMMRLLESGSPCDYITLLTSIQQSGELQGAGGQDYIKSLIENIPTSANAKAYADVIKDRSVLRKLQQAGTSVVELCLQSGGKNADEVIDEAEKLIYQVAERRDNNDVVQAKPLAANVLREIAELSEKGSHMTGVPTGFVAFDNLSSGLQAGDLIIVAGRPSSGKTSFAMNIAEHTAIVNKIPTLVFSMEMPSHQLIRRMISSVGRVSQTRLRTGLLEEADWPKVSDAVLKIGESPLFIDDTSYLTPSDMRAKSRKLSRTAHIGLIVIDYIQLMHVRGMSDNRVAEISEISRSIKSLAKELSIPIIALSQLNRNLEQRTVKRPVMSDLRDSGSIEQDADMIVFIYRDEMYDSQSAEKGKADVIVAKHRNGPTEDIKMAFRSEITRFENIDDENSPFYESSYKSDEVSWSGFGS